MTEYFKSNFSKVSEWSPGRLVAANCGWGGVRGGQET